MIQIIHNPHCSKSNCALDYLKGNTDTFEIRDYQENPLSVEELKEVCQKLGQRPETIVRKNEALFKEKFEGKTFTDEEWYQILAENPILLQRPIVIKGDKAVVARPLEKIEELS